MSSSRYSTPTKGVPTPTKAFPTPTKALVSPTKAFSTRTQHASIGSRALLGSDPYRYVDC